MSVYCVKRVKRVFKRFEICRDGERVQVNQKLLELQND